MANLTVGIRRQFSFTRSINTIFPEMPRLLVLLVGLYINRKIAIFFPNIWIIVPIFLSVALARARYSLGDRLVIRLWQFVGLLSAIYSFAHYPLIPPVDESARTAGLYGLLLLAWVISGACGVFCFKIPSLSILPPAFLLWSNNVAGMVTGLPIAIHIDVQPLTEVSVCIGLGLFINYFCLQYSRHRSLGRVDEASRLSASRAAYDAFTHLILLIAIAVHLANYFWSFYQKITLNGPFGSWVTENNPVYIFLAALDDGHIIFSGYPQLVQWAYNLLDAAHFYSNLWIIAIQAAALAAFFMPSRAFLILLLMFDVMHVAIIFIAGANFWPWIILNVIIAVVVASRNFRRQSILSRTVATGFILVAPHFVQVTKLGWYDSGANNKIYFEAVDESGKHYAVPTNFFTFYSYSFGHMEYGSPDPTTAFATGEPNGGVWDYRIFRAGRRCDGAALQVLKQKHWRYRRQVADFVRNYHQLALMIYSKIGIFPYDIYPHHFYVPPSEGEAFYRLDKRRIVNYIYKRESVCLTYNGGTLHRQVIASAEYTIDVSGKNRVGQ